MDALHTGIALCRAAEAAGYLTLAYLGYAWLTGKIGGRP